MAFYSENRGECLPYGHGATFPPLDLREGTSGPLSRSIAQVFFGQLVLNTPFCEVFAIDGDSTDPPSEAVNRQLDGDLGGFCEELSD